MGGAADPMFGRAKVWRYVEVKELTVVVLSWADEIALTPPGVRREECVQMVADAIALRLESQSTLRS